MKYIFSITIYFFIFFIASCGKKKQNPSSPIDVYIKQIEVLSRIKVSPKNVDSVKAAWQHIYTNPAVVADTLLYAKANYFFARFYGMQQHDSAAYFIEKAMELIENTDENWLDKAQIYNGMGNIWNNRAKEHQANYYYNKGASILLADTGIALSPSAKATILLAAAQSNKSLHQYELALQMNKAALALTPQLPKDHINLQRPLTQLIQTINAQHAPADSMAGYLQQLEKLHAAYPDSYDISFLYESKSIYFSRKNQHDSLLHYQLLKGEIDKEKHEANPTEQVFTNNLFISFANVGGTYVSLKNAQQANIYFGKAAQLLNHYKDIISIEAQVIYKGNLAALYELEGKLSKAVPLLFDANELQKKNFQTKNTQAVAEMNALYQLQAKDRSITTLNENINIKALQLEQNKLWLIISALAIILLGILLFFYYYTYRQRRIRQEKEQVLLQQQLLRTQMEPHFIFNTLSALQSFIRLDKKEVAITYLNRFSRLLRSSLELSRENKVPLGQEVEALENYLNLQQMRFENAFTYEINLPQEQDMESLMLPPMLIQPFVENAILHGIDLNSKTGFVHIRFTIDKDILTVIIIDSGRQNDIQKPLAHRSLSGIISKERIAHLGKQANVQVATKDNGTEVIMQIPVTY